MVLSEVVAVDSVPDFDVAVVETGAAVVVVAAADAFVAVVV